MKISIEVKIAHDSDQQVAADGKWATIHYSDTYHQEFEVPNALYAHQVCHAVIMAVNSKPRLKEGPVL